MTAVLIRFDRWAHRRRCAMCRAAARAPRPAYDPRFDAAFDEVYRS